MRLKRRETNSRGINRKAHDTAEAMVAAYLLPTMGLNWFIICLLALVR